MKRQVQYSNRSQLAKDIWALLIIMARKKRDPATYKIIASKVKRHWRNLGSALGEIQGHCHERNIPGIQSLVVLASTGLPSYNCDFAQPELHKKELEKVYAYGERWLEEDF